MRDGRKIEHCFSAGTKVQVCMSVICVPYSLQLFEHSNTPNGKF